MRGERRVYGVWRALLLAAMLPGVLALGACSGIGTVPGASAGTRAAEYGGWVVMRKGLRPEQKMPGHFSAAELDNNQAWIFIDGLRWNTKGSRVPVLIDGVASGYEVELVELPYKQRLRVLKLAVYETGRERALAYTWAEPGSVNIGINLRWMQAGLTRLEH